MSLATKQKKAEKLGIVLEEGLTEIQIDDLIETKQIFIEQQKKEEAIKAKEVEEAKDKAKKNTFVLRDVDGDDVDQAEYFFARTEEEVIDKTTHKPSTKTAPVYFNTTCGFPVDREDLIEAFKLHFPTKKGFLFYRLRDKEVYLIIVPLKYATTISKSNESRPGDFQRHALSFIGEGSVNVDSLKMKLAKVAAHSSISREPLA